MLRKQQLQQGQIPDVRGIEILKKLPQNPHFEFSCSEFAYLYDIIVLI